ncbi:AAA family ATPase [Amycolatopsis rubida]|uniref:AAA family ATPase n=1 Tax=Amycolatopsis rubida TaxID=112413 RepID=A0ABX0BJS1_9PSEU|nr:MULTISPECIES: LuxR family transcriptional regulator [Amycolatopsis]MYW90776.1 AAA family ATPase [Amycolatopsis rubida]NEC55759.1 AAA family ATPase [Amycolatopsis rubida]OAP26169.1 putative HTH-type transcriptional regulator [Amycolatopsis sp. M39]
MQQLVGRLDELARIARLTGAAARGEGGALLVLGGAGAGKSVFVNAAVDGLDDWLVLRATGTEFESDIPYAGVHQLCAPVLDRRADLPEPQRRALEAVFGLSAGPGSAAPVDVMLAGLAVLGLLADAAGDRPVCCVVDDSQWLDSASMQVLTFVARRIAAEPVAALFVAREAGSVPGLARLPQLSLPRLGDPAAAALLRATARAGLDEEIVERIVAEADGNPLALVEFARDAGPLGLGAAEHAGPRDDVVELLVERYVGRLDRLPRSARSVVELAAAEPVGDVGLLRRAATGLGLDAADLAVAEDAGLVVLGPRLRFRHPLVRSAAYGGTSPATRRVVHAALAEATDAGSDPDRRAWHRAHAVVDVDEDVAAELEASADRAVVRGGHAAAAAMLQRAAHITPETRRRTQRLLLAARGMLRAGELAAARDLIEQAERRTTDPADRAQVRLLRASSEYLTARSTEAAAALTEAADDLDVDAARETYLEAFSSSMIFERRPGRLRGLARSMRARAPDREPPRPVDLLLDAELDQILLPVGQVIPAMRRAVAAFAEAAAAETTSPWWLDFACMMALDLCDSEAMSALSSRQVELARRQGAVPVLAQALRMHAIAQAALGRFDAAEAAVEEGLAIDEATGVISLGYAELILFAWRGDSVRYDELRAMLGRRTGRSDLLNEPYATAVVRNGLGDYEAAIEACEVALEQRSVGNHTLWQIDHEFVEAAARAGRPEAATGSLDRLAAIAAACPTPWAVGAHLLARALLDDGPSAEAHYREAVDELSRSEVRVYYARSRLLYGEWLRRNRRRAEARVELRAAHQLLTAIGANAFADRASRELLATGERARAASTDPLGGLTAQERMIARKVATGATSKEVAGMLFLSPRTIETHLGNIYRKLGIASRRQLRDMPL